MRSKIMEEVISDTYRKVKFNALAYAKLISLGVRQRFHYYFDWKSFNLGFGFTQTTGMSGWKYMLSFDLGFFSCWIYFVKITK